MSATRRQNGAPEPSPRASPKFSTNPPSSKRRPATSKTLTTFIQPAEALLLLTYPALLLLGSLFSLLDPSARAAPYSAASQSHPPDAAPNYFALKKNVFNIWFVKVGWFWFTVAWAVWVVMGMGMMGGNRSHKTPLSQKGRIVELDDGDDEEEEEEEEEKQEDEDQDGIFILTPQKLQSILRWLVVTFWWMLVTQWCFGPALIDRGFRLTGGQCELMRSDTARQDMSDVREFVTGAACKLAGGTWKGGHDISGHVFILVLGSATLGLEVLGAMVNDQRAEAEEKQARLGKWGWGIVVGVVGMSWWMLLMTAAYFHTWFEKVSFFLQRWGDGDVLLLTMLECVVYGVEYGFCGDWGCLSATAIGTASKRCIGCTGSIERLDREVTPFVDISPLGKFKSTPLSGLIPDRRTSSACRPLPYQLTFLLESPSIHPFVAVLSVDEPSYSYLQRRYRLSAEELPSPSRTDYDIENEA